MPILHNARAAVIERSKVTRYCLDPDHEDGRHKARVFKSALGYGLANAGRFDQRDPNRYHAP
jgi:hypothetical protein